MTDRMMLAAAAPPAAAILVFGAIYGSLARPLLGVGGTVLSSLLIFSGAVQFTIAALLLAGASVGALIAGSLTLNVRNLLLGAVLRPRLVHGPGARAALGWFLTDESAGLALTSDDDAGRTLIVSGLLFYTAWQIGTALGLLGASLDAVRDAAEAVFPVLFIGLAALSCTTPSIALRALGAAVATAVGVLLLPDGGALAAVAAALVFAVPGSDR
jgi:predicted branched-subunit amino acid permease